MCLLWKQTHTHTVFSVVVVVVVVCGIADNLFGINEKCECVLVCVYGTVMCVAEIPGVFLVQFSQQHKTQMSGVIS